MTENTLLLLEAAADDNTKREEEDGRDDATAAEIILDIPTTVSTAVPVKDNISYNFHQKCVRLKYKKLYNPSTSKFA